MLEARRAERNYLLLRDPAYVEANRASIAKARETLIEIQNLAPSEKEDCSVQKPDRVTLQPVQVCIRDAVHLGSPSS